MSDLSATTNANALQDIIDLLGAGKLLDAFDKHYHEDVVMVDPIAGKVVGKAANRVREEAFVAAIASVQAFEVGPVLSGGNQTAYQNRFAFTTSEGQPVDLNQVAIQTWQDGKIIAEQFLPLPA